MAKSIGILTAGGDSPGLNAAIRAVGKTAVGRFGMQMIGFRDGFRGLVENRTVRLDEEALSGIWGGELYCSTSEEFLTGRSSYQSKQS